MLFVSHSVVYMQLNTSLVPDTEPLAYCNPGGFCATIREEAFRVTLIITETQSP